MTVPRSNASRDQNFVPTLMGVSSADGITPVPIEVDPTNGAILTTSDTSVAEAVAISDGTNSANVLKSDGSSAGQNAVFTAGSYRELAGLTAGALNADLVPSTDVSGYKWLSLQIAGTYSGTLTFQGSNDGTNFVSVVLVNTAALLSSGVTNTTATGIIYQGPVSYRYFRVRMTAYTSGTATGTLEAYTQATISNMQSVVATQQGTWTVGSNSATGSAVPANAFYSAMRTFAGNLTGLATAGASGDAGSTDTSLSTVPSIFNGTTIDRQRSATSAAGTTGTGVPAAGMLGFDGTNYQRAATSTAGNLKVSLYDPTGANNLTNQTDSNGDATTASVFLLGVANRNFLFNGTNFDRQRANFNTTTGDTGAKTTSFTGATQTNYNAAGANIVINMGTVTGTTPTLTAQVQGSADGGTTWFNITGAVTPTINATGVTVLTVYPGISAVANASIPMNLPRTWRLNYTIGGTTPSFTITNVQVAYNN